MASDVEIRREAAGWEQKSERAAEDGAVMPPIITVLERDPLDSPPSDLLPYSP